MHREVLIRRIKKRIKILEGMLQPCFKGLHRAPDKYVVNVVTAIHLQERMMIQLKTLKGL